MMSYENQQVLESFKEAFNTEKSINRKISKSIFPNKHCIERVVMKMYTISATQYLYYTIYLDLYYFKYKWIFHAL